MVKKQLGYYEESIHKLENFTKTNPMRLKHEDCKEFHDRFGVCLKKTKQHYGI